MRVTVWEGVASRLRGLYPERQVYFRANGAVRFFVIKPGAQVALTVVAIAAAAWIGIASANLLLEDRIIAAKEQRIDEIARAYRDLSGQMGELRGGVLETAKKLEDRQKFLGALVAGPQADAAVPDTDPVIDGAADVDPRPSEGGGAAKAIGDQSAIGHGSGLATRIGDVASVIFSGRPPPVAAVDGSAGNFGPLKRRLADIEAGQHELAIRLLARTVANLDDIEQIIRVTGLTGDKLLDALRAAPSGGQGGPFVGAPEAVADAPRGHPGTDDFAKLVAQFQRLEGLRAVLQSLPLGTPAEKYYISSSFGRRKDPFNKSHAFHAALDMSGPWKTPIYATAAGVVTQAGLNGPYGRFVEIDHGYGFKTRYGHMAKILVKKGERVEVHHQIGQMGSSGRSTSTHLHYEIWFEGHPRNPAKFLKAAQYVQQQ